MARFNPQRIIVHHSATKDSGTVSWNAIRRFHVGTNGWRDIGYHFGVERVTDGAGQSSVEVLLGRPWTEPGAHTVGHNADSLGVCVVGDFDAGPVPADVWEKTVQLVAGLCLRLNIGVEQIFGHRNFAKKTCPGNLFDVDALRSAVAFCVREGSVRAWGEAHDPQVPAPILNPDFPVKVEVGPGDDVDDDPDGGGEG